MLLQTKKRVQFPATLLGSLPAKTPASWWEKHANSQVNLLAKQTRLYADTGLGCRLDIKVLKSGTFEIQKLPKKCSIIYLNPSKECTARRRVVMFSESNKRCAGKTLGLQIELELLHPSSKKRKTRFEKRPGAFQRWKVRSGQIMLHRISVGCDSKERGKTGWKTSRHILVLNTSECVLPSLDKSWFNVTERFITDWNSVQKKYHMQWICQLVPTCQ